MDRIEIPNFEDVKSAPKDVKGAEEKLKKSEVAFRVLETLDQFKDEDVFSKEVWPIDDALKEDLDLEEKQTHKLFKDENEDFAVHHARALLKIRGSMEDLTKRAVAYWRGKKIPEIQERSRRPGRSSRPSSAATRPPWTASACLVVFRTSPPWTRSNDTKPTGSEASTRTWAASSSSRKPARPFRPKGGRPGPRSRRARERPWRAKWVRSAVFSIEAADQVQEPAGVDAHG